MAAAAGSRPACCGRRLLLWRSYVPACFLALMIVSNCRENVSTVIMLDESSEEEMASGSPIQSLAIISSTLPPVSSAVEAGRILRVFENKLRSWLALKMGRPQPGMDLSSPQAHYEQAQERQHRNVTV